MFRQAQPAKWQQRFGKPEKLCQTALRGRSNPLSAPFASSALAGFFTKTDRSINQSGMALAGS